MRNRQLERQRVSRRRVLTTALVGVCSLVPVATVFSRAASAAINESTTMNPTHLINALRSIGKPVCMDAANRLATLTGTSAGFDLLLRRAELNAADAKVLANGMLRSDTGNEFFLESFSASFNPDLGDTGAAALAEVFPESMTELGLVGCSIGDAGGRAILEWARIAPNLRMMCVEGNRFSDDMRSQFQGFAPQGRQILVVV